MCEGFCKTEDYKHICRKCNSDIKPGETFRVYMCHCDNHWGNFCLKCDLRFGPALRDFEYPDVETSDYPLLGIDIRTGKKYEIGVK